MKKPLRNRPPAPCAVAREQVVANPTLARSPGVRRTTTGLTTIVALVGFFLVGATPAQAATGVGKSGNTLTISAAPGATNKITISRSNDTFTIRDGGDPISSGTGCGGFPPIVPITCSAVGITQVVVNAGDLNDTVTSNSFGVRTTIHGGSGNDTLMAGPASGPVNFFGEDGGDVLLGGLNADVFDGGAGADTMIGGGSNDLVDYSKREERVLVSLDNAANDGQTFEGDNVAPDIESISGGSGNDILTGSQLSNTIDGNGGDDILNGGNGDDVLRGGPGADRVDGGSQNDRMEGGDGNDVLVGGTLANTPSPLASDTDVLLGGPGTDTADYTTRTVPVRVSIDDLANDGQIGGAAIEADNVRADVENIDGGSAADVLTGNDRTNRIRGFAGADKIDGLGSNDSLTGGADNDTITGGAGTDAMAGNNGEDTILAVDGVAETLQGGNQSDRCVGDAVDAKASCER
ncbi:calcium-binding protein [Arthrobacter sp. NPDC056691]|uniref:calcium-binding protein n=1 Tax=Arthrobacter sp. NPDC056691 TaxID=3345913 RepID=UPI00366D0642